MKQVQIDLQIKSKKWLAAKGVEKFIAQILPKLILLTEIKLHFRKKTNGLEVAISLVSNAQMKKINQQFRGKNKATDVLSFSALDENLIRAQGFVKATKNQPQIFLGDIVLAYETIAGEALAEGKTFNNHLTHLLLHSILHLVGHDHENDKDAKIMEGLEIKILQKLKMKNPY